MSFPQVAATNTSAETNNVTTHTVNLPSGIVAGDLLILLIAADGSETLTLPSGFNLLALTAWGGLTARLGYKIADGTEGSTTTFSTSAGERSAHQSYRINGWRADTPPEVSANAGTSASATFTALDPVNWDVEDTLWLAFAVSDADTTFSVDPTGYTNAIENDSGSGSTGVKVRSLRLELRAASETPSAMTNTSNPWETATVAVRPAAAAYGRRAFRGGP